MGRIMKSDVVEYVQTLRSTALKAVIDRYAKAIDKASMRFVIKYSQSIDAIVEAQRIRCLELRHLMQSPELKNLPLSGHMLRSIRRDIPYPFSEALITELHNNSDAYMYTEEYMVRYKDKYIRMFQELARLVDDKTRALIEARNSDYDQTKEAYDIVLNALKNIRSANNCIKYLKECGFDVTKIKHYEKSTFPTVDKDALFPCDKSDIDIK